MDSVIQCVDCQKMFSTRVRLLKHKCSKCTSCGKVLSSFQRLQSHNCSDSQDIQVKAIEQHGITFNPVHCQWQLDKCRQFTLPLKIALPSTHQLLPAGAPKHFKRVGGDGNCFFRCLSLAVTGCEEYHLQLRAAVCHFMTQSAYTYRIEHVLLQQQGLTAASYLTRSGMRNSGTWATEVEIYSAALMLNTRICVYRNVVGQSAWHTHDPRLIAPQTNVSSQCIYINHPNNTHYEIVTDVHLPSDEPVLSCQHQQVHVPVLAAAECEGADRPLVSHTTRTVTLVNHRNTMRKQRQNQEYSQKEAERNRLRMIKQRATKQYSQREAERNRLRMIKQRATKQYSQREAERNRLRMIKQRATKQYSQREAERNRLRMIKQRATKQYSQKEAERNRLRITKQRATKEYNQREAERNRLRITKQRATKEYSQKEAGRSRQRMATRRGSKEYREKEALKDRQRKAEQRQNRNYRRKESESDRLRKVKRRRCPSYRHREAYQTKVRAARNKLTTNSGCLTVDDIKEVFQSNVSHGPSFICTCCNGLFYKHSVSVAPSAASLQNKGVKSSVIEQVLLGTKSFQNTEWICSTCLSGLRKSVLPNLAVRNGLGFPAIPPPLKGLTTLEERCISPRIPFMQMRELGCDHQFGIRGNVVNVPVDVPAMVTSLPRRFEETETIALKLKRRLRYKSSYHFENVRPGKIFAAAEWLIGNSDLFREEGIKLDPSWFKPEWEGAESVEFRTNSADDDSCIQGEKTNHTHSCDEGKQPECDAVKQCSNVPAQGPEHLVTDQASGTVKDNNKPDQDGNPQEEYADLFQEWPEENIPANDKDDTGEDDEDKEWVETSQEAELGGGCRDTLLHPNDFTTDGQQALNIAPGEGKHPLGLFMDKDCEEKSFPTIFCGQRRVDNSDRMKPLTYSKVCKAELRSADRRAAHSIPNLFFKLKKLQMLQIRDLATTALRKVKGAKSGHTAGQLKKDGAIEDLLRQDQGYRVLKTLRSSPPYWQAKQKDLFAMIRQLGRPTFFATFSAAETRWLDLLRVLYRMEHSVDPTDDDLEKLTWQEKSQLIQTDPVTCARHFDYRVQVLFRKVILSDLQPLGKVTDHFFRVEFQQRGSPHIHCMIWVEDAPKADTDSDEDVVAFLDKHLTCRRHEEGELKDVSSLHEHKHSKSCKKGGKHVCRFGFPLPPMSKTMLLRPITQSEVKENSGITEKLKAIKRELSQLKPGENISFEEFLARVGIDENQYILALRSDLDSTKIFLRREPSATRMNSRNDILAQVWMANTDVQFVLDEYACGMYIVTYISKSQQGMSDLLKNADDEAKRGNNSVKQKVRHIANKFLNHCEVSAQEAVYLLMQLPLTRCTRDVIFVNTSPPCQRVGLLKNSTMLEAMKDDDTDVTLTSLIDRYSERPKELEDICLAEFATSYDVKRAGSSSRTGKNTKKKQDFLPEGEYEEDATDNIWDNDSSSGHLYKLPDGKVLHHRKKPKVLRCVRFSLESDSENHYREKLMLYIPWRNEDKDIIGECGTYHERFEQMKEILFEVSSKFETNATAVDQAVEQVQKDGIDEEAWDGVAPQAQDMESRHEKYNTESTINAAFQPDSEQHRQYDIGLDLGCHATSDITHDRIVNRIPNEEYDAMVRSLNCSQQAFFYHILHWVKTKCSGSLSECEPFYCFLSGGAGVGKSRCVLAVYHALVRYLSSRPGDNPDRLRVLLAAPTGKAAYNIRGVTLHTAFCLPANQSLSDYVKLDASRLNTLRSTLAELRLLIIDEISMVGANMLGFVSQRLQQVMGCSKPFGGVSVLAVGDLFQLRPVMDRWVFQPSRGPYEALAPIVWQELFQMFELTQVMRQKDDKTFAEALNRIREGCHTKEDASLIKSRVVKSSIPDNMLHLFTSRRLVTEQNTRSLALLQSLEIVLEAKDTVMGDISVALKTEILHKARDMTVQQTQSLPSHLTLKVGGRFMLVHNVDISDGLTNGASGTLRQVGHKGSEKPEHVSVVWIEFDEESVGEKTRHQNKQLYTPAISCTWTPIFHAVKQFRVGKRENVSVLRKQFPLTACSAITVHKSQGSTLEQVAVSFQGMVQHHLVYVALSRAKTLGGLHLLDFDPNKIRVSPDVKTEMERLRKKPIEWCVSDLQQIASIGFLIGFHNSRSLHKHMEDLRLERNLLRAEMLFIFESWEHEQDEPHHYSLPEFKVLDRNPAPTKTHRPHAGTIVYIRDDSLLSTSNTATSRSCNHSIEVIVLDASSRIAGLSVVGVYCPPGVKTSALRTELETILHRVLASYPYVVMGGDFNSDASDRLSKPLEQLCQEFSLRQLITEPTTDYGSVLDLIFTNLPESAILGGVLESWYSDHKPCWVSISV